VFLLVKYLLHGSGQMRPEAGVGTGRLRDPLLQRPVGVAPRLLEVVMLRVQEVVHLGPKSLRLRPGSLRVLDIILGEMRPSFRNTNGRINLLNAAMDVDGS